MSFDLTRPISKTKFRSTSNCTTRQVLGWKKRIEVIAVKAALTLDVGVVGKPGMAQGWSSTKNTHTHTLPKSAHACSGVKCFCGSWNEWHISKTPSSHETEAEHINFSTFWLYKRWMHLYSLFLQVEAKTCQNVWVKDSMILWFAVLDDANGTNRSLPLWKLTWQWKIHHLKMYFLLKIRIFQCHVSFQRV